MSKARSRRTALVGAILHAAARLARTDGAGHENEMAQHPNLQAAGRLSIAAVPDESLETPRVPRSYRSSVDRFSA